MSRYYSSYSSYDSSWGSLVGIVVMILVLCFIFTCCNASHIESERADAHMIYIKDGYCYNDDTKIIHIETIVNGGRSYDTPVYYPYINENGNYCKYEHGKWIEIIKD